MERIKLFMGPTLSDLEKQVDDWTGSKEHLYIVFVGPPSISQLPEGRDKLKQVFSLSVVYSDSPLCSCDEDDEDEDHGYHPRPNKK